MPEDFISEFGRTIRRVTKIEALEKGLSWKAKKYINLETGEIMSERKGRKALGLKKGTFVSAKSAAIQETRKRRDILRQNIENLSVKDARIIDLHNQGKSYSKKDFRQLFNKYRKHALLEEMGSDFEPDAGWFDEEDE